MKVTLRIQKDQSVLFEGLYDVCDAESFGRACADIWDRLRERRLAGASSVGELFDELDDRLLDELYGAEVSILKP